ncbi:alpha/beta hydrolase [Roseobacter sinensis]|uniref:Alpha/beta hydrolase n=1 Tax=Roseobacter sinensis TaxID=2931391 RepID=A0ABT3BC98_9RHOB|nr:alpha/beta hydrolase [Roseobacter sp. WL0113]MCV3271175.1 alpha/beta hydrolase [Roseobacter sp. WL0113]
MSVDLYRGPVTAPDPGQPVIFAFHGTGGNAAEMHALARQIMPGAGVIAPQGDVSEHGAARFFRRTAEGVYDMPDLAQRTQRMAAYVAAQKAHHPGHRVYAFGYSNGANILASVAMAQPELFDRIGLLHPLIPWAPDPVPELQGTPVLVSAGRHDPICPWPLTERLVDWFEAQGAEVRTEIHEGGHELRPAELVALKALFSTQKETAALA